MITEEQIIVPPQQIKQLIEETAQKVADRGRQFEVLFMKTNKDDPNYKFLQIQSPYRNYYDQKVVQYAQKQVQNNDLDNDKQQEENIVKDQKEQFDFYTNSPIISIQQDQIIKQTAYYTALKGESFLELIQKQKENDIVFNFLKINHPHFHYFTILVDSYIYLLKPEKELLSKILEYSKDENNIYKQCEKLKEQTIKKQKIQSKLIQETYNDENEQIYEWDNFKIVATIDFNSQINFIEREEQHDEDRYKFNPQNAIIFDALKKEI